MAGEEQSIVRLKSDFYRDGYRKILVCLGLIITAIGLLIASSIYLYVTKPPPVYFATDKEWRTLPLVPVELPYLSTADLLQWVSNVMMSAFYYDFVHYNNQIQELRQYFTDQGWLAFQGMLTNYASSDSINVKKYFINGAPDGAPFVLNEGLLDHRYAWWVQIPIQITYTYFDQQTVLTSKKRPIFQLLVVRIPTANNIFGVAIDNVRLISGEPVKSTSATNG